MPRSVHVIGVGRTDFRRNLLKEGKTIGHLIAECGRAAITDAGIEPGDITSGVVGNFASGLFTRQLHLGAYLVGIDEALRGMPTVHVEAACASGGVAVLTAAQQIIGGLHEVVLVVGVEQQKTMSPADGSEVLAAAGDYAGERPLFGDFMFPKLFARIARIYTERHGLREEDLARVSAKNHAHARLNPLAQMRDSGLTFQEACTESVNNRRFAPPLKLTDCSQITDGAASLVLCSDDFARGLAGKPGRRRPGVRLRGYGHATDRVALEKKDAPDFAIARSAAAQAYRMAGLSATDVQAAELHDCFSISEVLSYEILGFAERGKGAGLLSSGVTALPSVREKLDIDGHADGRPAPVVNPGGGLMGDGHPVGATGVRQVVEAYAHLTDNAGSRQVKDVRRYLTFNIGGSFTTSVAMIWERTQ